MPSVIEKTKIKKVLSNLSGVTVVAFTDFVFWMLVILQVAFYAAHIDGLSGFERWHVRFAVPAILIVVFIFVEACLAVAALFIPDEVANKIRDGRTVDADEAVEARRMQTATLGKINSSLVLDYLVLMSDRMKMMRMKTLGTCYWVSSVVHSLAAFSAGIILVLYSAEVITYEKGFSYVLVIMLAFMGKILLLITTMADFILSGCRGGDGTLSEANALSNQ